MMNSHIYVYLKMSIYSYCGYQQQQQQKMGVPVVQGTHRYICLNRGQIFTTRVKTAPIFVAHPQYISSQGLGSESPRTHLSTCDDLDLTHLNVRRS